MMAGLRVCRLLGIRFPILQGGMLWIADAVLASSVSDAGALGTISPYAGMNEGANPIENLRDQIRKTRRLTQKPFAVNIPLDLPDSGLLINVLLEEEVRIAVTAAGSPALYTELLQSSGAKVLHVISSKAQAQFAQSCGVDAVIAAGAEAGGRIGRDEMPLSSLIAQVANAVSIPIVAAGGIVDTHGIVQASALGADGVQLGTRFIASDECIAHPNYKVAIIKTTNAGTIVTGRMLGPARRLKTKFSLELAALEQTGAPIDIERLFVSRGRARKAQILGMLEEGDFYAGSSAERISSVLPVAQIIGDLIGATNLT